MTRTDPGPEPARTAVQRTLDTIEYFFEAARNNAGTVLRTAHDIVHDRDNGKPEPPRGEVGQPSSRKQRERKQPLTEAQVRDIRRRYDRPDRHQRTGVRQRTSSESDRPHEPR